MIPTNEELKSYADLAHEVAFDLQGERRNQMFGVADALRRCIEERNKANDAFSAAEKMKECMSGFSDCFIELCVVCHKKCAHPENLASDLKDRIAEYETARAAHDVMYKIR